MNKIKWCKKQVKGIKIVEINENLSKNYLLKSEDALGVMINSPSEDWKIITAYYACYNSLYALFQAVGIKCEIHNCSLELMKFFPFSKEEIDFLEDLKEKRINVQYYNKKENLVTEKEIKKFILRCKEILLKEDLTKIRGEIKKITNL